MAGADDDDKTPTGVAPLLLEGSPEARTVADLAVKVKFYGSQLEQLAGELRRAPGPVPATVWLRMRELTRDMQRTTAQLAPRGQGT